MHAFPGHVHSMRSLVIHLRCLFDRHQRILRSLQRSSDEARDVLPCAHDEVDSGIRCIDERPGQEMPARDGMRRETVAVGWR